MAERLATLLADYDGRRVDVLEGIRDRIEPDATTFHGVLELTCGPDADAAAGATWLLRAWLEGGASLPADFTTALAGRLGEVEGAWARQHLCQTIAHLRVAAPDAEAFADFLRTGLESPRPFLRAWSVDGLVRLAEAHPRFATEAEAALSAAMTDDAASVRARARRILAERDG